MHCHNIQNIQLKNMGSEILYIYINIYIYIILYMDFIQYIAIFLTIHTYKSTLYYVHYV